MKQHLSMVIVCLALIAPAAIAAEAPQVTFQTLLQEMVDLESLTRFPSPGYATAQFSSYDRKSTDPAVLTDDNWFANADRGQHIRVEERNGEQEWVMMDVDGPGAIVRIWSANPDDAGVVRIYLDEQPEPVVEMPLTALLGGEHAPFVRPIAGTRARGWNSFLPIPYAKQCKVTASKPDFYYHINFRRYAPETAVETWSQAVAAENAPLITAVAERLAHPARRQPLPDANRIPFQQVLEAGESSNASIDGPAAIRWFSVQMLADDLPKALRGTLLEIAFDGAEMPQIQAPLGDFFGTAPGINEFLSLPCGVLPDGTLYAQWVMPFARSAAVQITNHTDAPITLYGEFVAARYAWGDRSMHFHAKWRAESPVPTRPRQDWTYLSVKGTGVFVGDMLQISNPVQQWWGEGDEKIYVDNEEFPSHFGTGSEDYYGYAWCSPELFTHAYHNQSRCDGPGNYGFTSVNRFHIIDNIPFTEAFKFDIEVWHWAETEVAMAATSYWYAVPGAADFFAAPAPEALVVVAPAPLKIVKVEGAIEGEKLPVISYSGGSLQTQNNAQWDWSGNEQVWWRDAAKGSVLSLGVPVAEAGRYRVSGVFTEAPDYGIMQLAINGEKAGQPIDFYAKDVGPSDKIELGEFDLKQGQNTLTVEVTGANAAAAPGNMFGLDYLLLEPAKD